MTAFRTTLLLTLGLLAACDEPPKSPQPVPTPPRIEPAVESPLPVSASRREPLQLLPPDKLPTLVAKPLAPAAAASQPGAVSAATAPSGNASSEAQASPQALPSARLDLRLPAGLVEQMEPGEPQQDLSKEPLLPPLFVEKPVEPGPFQLNGRLISNDHSKEDYWDSLEGAELQFEFRN